MMMMTFFGMYKDVNNVDKITDILLRPEFGSVRLAEHNDLRKQGLAEIFNMGETEIYQQLKKAYNL